MDLTTNDFFLLSLVWKILHDHRFSIPEEVTEACISSVSAIQISQWHTCFEDWYIQIKICTDAKGKYFEE